jgi:hypothetical protein
VVRLSENCLWDQIKKSPPKPFDVQAALLHIWGLDRIPEDLPDGAIAGNIKDRWQGLSQEERNGIIDQINHLPESKREEALRDLSKRKSAAQ